MIDLDVGWAKLFYEMLVGFAGGLIAIFTAIFTWRRKSENMTKASMASLKQEIAEDYKATGVDIEDIRQRLERGNNRMTRIEENLKHMPTHQQFTDIIGQLASLHQANKANTNILNVIRNELIKQGRNK